jgi:very-short-patch-repair endonuclease
MVSDVRLYLPYNKEIVAKAKELRMSMTPEEQKLWYHFLCNYPIRLTRQKIIDTYILDFYCAKAKLDIEIDGNQHLSIGNEEHDAIRTGKLNQFNIAVVRFTNTQINQCFEDVCRQIDSLIKQHL